MMTNEEKLVILGYSAVVLTILIKKVGRKYPGKQRNRRMWARSIYLRRGNCGFYNTLVKELQLHSPELFFNFTRMTA